MKQDGDVLYARTGHRALKIRPEKENEMTNKNETTNAAVVEQNVDGAVAEQNANASPVCACPHCGKALPNELVAGAKAKQPKNRTYVLQNTAEWRKSKVAQMPPQARACLDIMHMVGKDEITEAELVEAINKNASLLRTKQDPWRIFQYYRAGMNSANLFTMQ